MRTDHYLLRPNTILNNHKLVLDQEQYHRVGGTDNLPLDYSFEYKVKEIIIIDGPNKDRTFDKLKSAAVSIPDISFKVLPSFNILDSHTKITQEEREKVEIHSISVPAEVENKDWCKHVRVLGHKLTYREVTRILNHMNAWSYCIHSRHPVIILEDGMVMEAFLGEHLPRGSIAGLTGPNSIQSLNKNYKTLSDLRAYSIDVFAAELLFNHVISNGILNPLEYIIRADQFCVWTLPTEMAKFID